MRYSTDHGFYELNAFPGCNQMVISNHSWIDKEFRGKGIGSKEHEARLGEITKLGYDYVICTCKFDNQAQISILNKFGWKYLHWFDNRETGNQVQIWGKQL